MTRFKIDVYLTIMLAACIGGIIGLKHLERPHEQSRVQTAIKYDARWGKGGVFHWQPDVHPDVKQGVGRAGQHGVEARRHAVGSQRKAVRTRGSHRPVVAQGRAKDSTHSKKIVRAPGVGIYRGEVMSLNAWRHGHTAYGKKTPLYSAWRDARNRCNNPNNKNYDRYGGRGITVCKRWDKFENFAVDMGPHPGKGLTLGRRDNNKGYSKANCNWETRKAQANNRCVRKDSQSHKTVKVKHGHYHLHHHHHSSHGGGGHPGHHPNQLHNFQMVLLK